MFDPHSRDNNGLCCQDGKAVNTCYENTKELISYFTNLAKSTGQEENTPYELVPCIIKQPSMSEDCQSSFPGLSQQKEEEPIKKRKKVNKKKQKKKHTTQTHTLTQIVKVIPMKI